MIAGDTGSTESSLNVRRYLLGNNRSFFSFSTYHIGGDAKRAIDQRTDEVYMRRWILHTPWGSLRLHHILRSDHARDLHDHPFSFWTLLLTGGYVEWLPTDAPESQRALAAAVPTPGLPKPIAIGHHRHRFSFRFVQAEVPHRLDLDQPVWTLVWATPKFREWGFYVRGIDKGHWVNAREYLGGESTP